MGSMLMNMAANMLGLGNAATPLGLRAMRDLERLNPHPGTATNAMCTFLAINTSSVQLIPTTAIAILVAAGSTNPTAIVGTALLATLCAATVAITSAKLLEKLPIFQLERLPIRPATGASGEVRSVINRRIFIGSIRFDPACPRADAGLGNALFIGARFFLCPSLYPDHGAGFVRLGNAG